MPAQAACVDRYCITAVHPSPPFTPLPERAIEAELVAGKTYLAARPDAAGRPLLLTASNRHLRAARDAAAMELALVYAMDVASLQADATGDGRVVSVMDARGVRGAHVDATVAKLVVDVAQNHYPERALHTHVYGSPRLFSALIAWLLPFIAPATRGKVTFVSGPPEPKTWAGAACVTVDTLPLEIGGRGGAAVPVQDAARAVGLVKGSAVPPPPKVWAAYGVPASRARGGKAADGNDVPGVALTADASTAGA